MTDEEGKLLKALAANEHDRSKVAVVLHEISTTIAGYRWATEGRGPYEWNDDNYMKVFGEALDAIQKAAEPLKLIAADMSDCPTTPEEIKAARAEPVS